MTPSARGVEILKGSKAKWKIGKKLGSGACATVHSLETIDGDLTEFAAKVVPIPKKKTKKQNSEEETNARLLYFEHLVYSNIVPDIRGTYVPRLAFSSKEPPSHGEAGGFHFMIIEKMDCELSDIVPMLLHQSKGATINFGPIAAKLLECIQAIQERKQVVVDIKPENFMLTTVKGKGSTDIQKLASRIRLLDLALVQPWSSIGSHRTNDGTSGIAGTPLYASLNVHDGMTPSRRDDFESIWYVIAELIMKLVAGDPSVELPWSHGNSDDEIGQMKKENMMNEDSEFWNQLGGTDVIKIMSGYMEEVRGYSFKKLPDYNSLVSILSKLKIPKPSKAPSRASKARASSSKKIPLRTVKVTPSSRPRTRAQKRASSFNDEEEEERVQSPRKIARDKILMDTDMEIVIDCSEEEWTDAQPIPHYETPRGTTHDDDDDDDDDDDSFATASMEWEATLDENEEPSKPAAKPTAVKGVTVLVESGPDKGRSFNMIKGRSEIFVVGKNPSSTIHESTLTLSKDNEADDSHIRMELSTAKKLTSIRVIDLKSTTGTFVGKEMIRKGKDYRIFQGESVRIGESVLTVKKLDPSASSSTRKVASRVTGRPTRATRSTRSTPESVEVIEVSDSPAASKTKKQARLEQRGVQLIVTQGPHKGEIYVLESGGDETLVIGSNPTSRTGAAIELNKDRSLKATHVQVDLNVAKKLTTVTVTDKSRGGTLVNRNIVKKGRAFINDMITIGESILEIKPLP